MDPYSKKQKVALFILLFTVIVLSLILIFFPRVNSLIVTRFQTEIPALNKLDIQKVSLANPTQTVFVIRGYFIDRLDYNANGSLMGRFVINGDQTKTPLTTLLSGRGGRITLGEKDIQGNLSWRQVTSEEIKLKVIPDTRIELKIIARDGQEFNQKPALQLSQIIQFGSTRLENLIMLPEMVGIL